MLLPFVKPRVKEPDQITRGRNGREVGTLQAIADHASVGKIRGDRLTTVLSADYVIDFVSVDRVVFMNPTILTPRTGTARNGGAQF